jgi:hypothetical protein
MLRNRFIAWLLCLLCWSGAVQATEYHVAVKGDDKSSGSARQPFRTISHAAAIAVPGDMITIHAGVYREMVSPARGGLSADKRIIYRAAPGEKAEIRGSEVITGWQRMQGDVWKVELDDTFFGAYDPYTDRIAGDWYFGNMQLKETLKGDWYYHKDLHTGEVYLNGRSLHEADSLGVLLTGANIGDPFGVKPGAGLDGSYTWYSRHTEGKTILYADFHAHDPNKELVEINVRPACFYPAHTGVNYLTVRGLYMSQAATQWAAPTAEQAGALGTNWSRGWVIEDNVVSESKCAGITLGKDRASGQNEWMKDMSRDGSGIYNEVIRRAISEGWSKNLVGGHLVRRNTIFNCGQAGICGSLGAIFSTIESNHIYNIYTKRRFWGAEMGGIKIHGAIDVLIRGNEVHNCYQGIWLDWMAQGARVSGNRCYQNDFVDLFVEVDHGPYLVDNNSLLSGFSVKDWSEGGAYVHNLVRGLLSRQPQERETPYFKMHTTELVATRPVRGGDTRFYNNVFVGVGNKERFQASWFLPADAVDSSSGYGISQYSSAALPVQADGNVYLNGALPLKGEVHFIRGEVDPEAPLDLPALTRGLVRPLVTTALLGRAIIPDGYFEQPDGKPLKVEEEKLLFRIPR